MRLKLWFAGCFSALAVALAVPGVARAQVFDSGGEDYAPPKPERRYGFTAGLSLGMGYGSALGYPNKLDEIGDPAFEQSVSGVGSSNGLWIGGTLRDWITFGIGVSSRGTPQDERVAGSFAYVLHIEGFPLWSLGGPWQDVGVFTETGIGGALILDADQEPLADGGAMAVIGVGAFWEPLRWWHFSLGPAVQYTHEFSPSLAVHTATLGLRAVFYGVQPNR